MTRFYLIPIAAAAGGAVALAAAARMNPVPAWLVAITLVCFATYGYDKMIAGSRQTRVPEKALLVLAAAGGTVGAVMGMLAFRHKTAKSEFQVKLGLVVVVQIAVIVAYVLWIQPWLATMLSEG